MALLITPLNCNDKRLKRCTFFSQSQYSGKAEIFSVVRSCMYVHKMQCRSVTQRAVVDAHLNYLIRNLYGTVNKYQNAPR